MPAGLIELATAPEPLGSSAGTLDPPAQAAPGGEPPLASASAVGAEKTAPLQIVLLVLATIAFLFFARTVVLPVFLACVAGMALKPLIRWLSLCHIPPASRRGRALPAGVRPGHWVFPIGPPGDDLAERSAAAHDRVKAAGPADLSLAPRASARRRSRWITWARRQKNKSGRPRWNSEPAVSLTYSIGPAPSWWAWAKPWFCFISCSPRATCSCKSWST